MDQKQKDLLSSSSPQLAEEIDFYEIADLLQLSNLVSKDRIEIIVRSVDSQFSRNLKLLDSLQESDSPEAFNTFVRILEHTNNDNALKIISPKGIKAKPSSNIYSRLAEKFSKIGFRNAHYPIGMNSSKTSTTMDSILLPSSNHQDPTSSSPLKERHQATLISSSDLSKNDRSDTARDSSDFKLHRNNSSALSPSTIDLSPVVSSSQEHGDKLSRHVLINKYSQTPTKPQNVNYHQNNSISDTEDDNNHNNGSEPIVCWHPYAHERTQPQSSDQDTHRASSPNHCCLPSYASSESDSSSDSVVLDQNLIRDSSVTMALASEGFHVMKIQKATNVHRSKHDYKMSARPRGPCLIVNNIDFEGEVLPTRKGSDEDSKRFDSIFQQLGFTVIMRRNQTADQMKKLFKDVAAQCRSEHDALFVIVLSHGSEHGIYGTDGLEVSVDNEILPCFDNRNCKAMREKPKVFIIQACRGMANDFGVDVDRLDSVGLPPDTSNSTARFGSQENRWLPSSQPSEGKKRKHHTQSDMLIVYPCLAGYVSVRNELRGSWLGVALAYFILLEAHNLEFERILNLVTNDVMQRESSTGHIQALERKHIGWSKNLYFNPGYYETDTSNG